MTNAKDGPGAEVGELWDANDAARYLKVSHSWVYQRAEARLLPCLRVGGLLRFDPNTVHAFRRERTVDCVGHRAMLVVVQARAGHVLAALEKRS